MGMLVGLGFPPGNQLWTPTPFPQCFLWDAVPAGQASWLVRLSSEARGAEPTAGLGTASGTPTITIHLFVWGLLETIRALGDSQPVLPQAGHSWKDLPALPVLPTQGLAMPHTVAQEQPGGIPSPPLYKA